MSPRQLTIGSDVAVALIALSVAAALGDLVWHVIMPPSQPHAVPTRTRPVPPASADIAPIVGLAPFGSPEASTPTGEAAGALVLRGILLANPSTLSTALISGAQGTARAYRVGDRLPDGSELSAVAARWITLKGPSGEVRLGFPTRADRATGLPGEVSAGGPVPSVDVPDAAVPATPPREVSSGRPADGKAPPPGVLSGVAAIRALIPPSVAGIPSAPPTAQNQAPPPPSRQ